MIRLQCFALAALAAGAPLFAGQTHTWSQGDFAGFEKGVIKHLSVRSDGVLALALKSRELLDTSSPYLWALARDSKGNLYAGGGTGAKLYQISPGGQHKVLAELEGLEIHAIAIDRHDRIYAATSPDGKIYRVTPNGKSEVFFDPKAKYIWGMAFNPAGDLFVATGDKGEIYRVTPDGKGAVFFKTDETHVRSMAIGAQGNLIAGTEPSGLVIRVSPAGEGFVLYQMGKKEVTAVAIAGDGAIYAAGVGNKQPALPSGQPALSPVPPQVAIAAAGAGASVQAAPMRVAMPLPPSFGGTAVTGGSELVRIEPNGNPRRIWSDAHDVVYAIALDAAGRVVLGTGNKGVVYRIESPLRYTSLLTLPATQVTAFLPGAEGRLYAITGNAGKVYEIGPDLEREGSIESDVFDSGMYSTWGRLTFEAKLNGGHVAIAAHSGNLDQPQKNWSPWTAAIASAKGDRVTAPAARFVQWKATLTASAAGQSPELESVDVAYLPKNVEPRLEDIEITPANYKFPAPTTPSTAPPSLSLPPMGRQRTQSSLSLDTASTPSLTYAKGAMSARWMAADANGDTLVYTVQIRGIGETEWKPLKDKVRERYCSWDATAFPDGEYRLRLTASDTPSNPPAEALTGQLESDPFFIDNTPPKIVGLTAAHSGKRIEVKWHAADTISFIKQAEYSLDGGEWTVAAPVTRLSDSLELDYVLSLDGVAAGEHTVAVRVSDDYDNQTAEKVVVR
jgi:hypothetical protein